MAPPQPLQPFSSPSSSLQPALAGAPPVETIPSYGSPPSGGARALGALVIFALIGVSILSVFVLYKNDWSFDGSNVGGMLSKAFGLSKPVSRFEGLEISQPVTRTVELTSGTAVVAEGVVDNRGPFAWRFIYVRAVLKRHGRRIAKRDVPAGNVVAAGELTKLSAEQWESRMTPAGTDGCNTKVDAAESIAYQVLLSKLPADYAPSRYEVEVEVSEAEKHTAP